MNKDKQKHLEEEVRAQEGVMKEFPMLEQAVLIYRAQLFDSFTKTLYNDTDAREEVYRQMKVIDTVMGKLTKILQTGELARKTLDKKY